MSSNEAQEIMGASSTSTSSTSSSLRPSSSSFSLQLFNHYDFFELLAFFYFEKLRGFLATFVFNLGCIICLVTYFFMILVSGGVFLVAVLVPYLGYKIYQKFCKCTENGSLCFARRRGQMNHGSSTDIFRNFFQGKIIPKVELDFPSGLRAGQTVNFRIVVRRILKQTHTQEILEVSKRLMYQKFIAFAVQLVSITPTQATTSSSK